MQVCVLYFGVLKDVCGTDRTSIELDEGSTVASLVDRVLSQTTGNPGLWESIAVAVNQEYVRNTVILQDGDEVALLPPVSGGSRGFVDAH